MHSAFNPDTFSIAKPTGIPQVLFQLGSWSFHTYSMTMMLGMLAAIVAIVVFWRREKYSFDILLVMVIITIPSSLFGARLWFVVERLIYNPSNPFPGSAWYAAWDGGLSIQGGVMLAVSLNMWYAWTKRYEIDVRKAISIIIPNVLIGQVIGRFGNFANHEIYGSIDWTGSSSRWLGDVFAGNMFLTDYNSTKLGIIGAFRHPLFLYEAGLNLLGWIILVGVINGMWLLKPGSTGALYFVWYGFVRMIMEPYRTEAYSIYQITSTIFIVFGIIAFVIFEFLWDSYRRVWIKKSIRFEMVRVNPLVKPEKDPNHRNWFMKLFKIKKKEKPIENKIPTTDDTNEESDQVIQPQKHIEKIRILKQV